MRTLTQPISRWLTIGQKPRTFVRITDASTGAEILPVSSMAQGTYEDRLTGSSTITREIRHEGGCSVVGAVDIDVDIRDTDFTLCENPSLAPRSEGSTNGAGRFMVRSYFWLAARNNASATDLLSPQITVGRNVLGITEYLNFRGMFQCGIPSGMTTIEDGYLELTGLYDYHGTTHWKIHLLEGTWTNINSAGTAAYGQFAGWAASGDYAVTDLNEEWTTEQYGDTVRIRLNAAGLTYALSKTGGTARFILLADTDVNASTAGTPTQAEYVIFEASSARLVLRYNTTRLENQVAKIYFAVDPVPADVTGMDCIWTGLVDSYSMTERVLSLALKQNDHRYNPMVPDTLITTALWPGCPEQNVGKAVPFVYGEFALTGEHRTGVANLMCYTPGGFGAGLAGVSYPDCFRGIVVKNADGEIRTLFSRKAMKSYGSSRFVFTANQAIQGFEFFAVHATVVYNASYGTYSVLSAPDVTDVFMDVFAEGNFRSVTAIMPSGNETFGADDPENAYDTDSDTYAEIDTDGGYIDFLFANQDGVAGESVVGFVVYAEFTGGMAPGSLAMKFYRNQRDETTDPDNWVLTNSLTPWSADGQKQYSLFNVDATYRRTPVQLGQIKMRLEKTGATGTARIYDVCALAAHDTGEVTEVYSYGQGLADDGSGTVTGTPGALIENPAHVIESFAREEMKLAAGYINTSSFDAAATVLAGLRFAFQQNDRVRARELLDDLAYQAGMKVWRDGDDRLKGKVFDADGTFPVSGKRFPNALDTFTTTGDPSGSSFTTHQIVGEMTLRPRLAEMKNDFVLKYRLNYATGEYGAVLTCTKDGCDADDGDFDGVTGAELAAVCDAAYDLTGTVETLEVEAPAIRDDATAARLLQHLVTRLAKVPFQVSFTAGPSANVFEEADFINIRSDLIEARLGTARMEMERWEIIRNEPDVRTHDVAITAVQVM